MTLDEFFSSCDSNLFVDGDGVGYLAKSINDELKRDTNPITPGMAYYASGKNLIRSTGATHIYWFNQ